MKNPVTREVILDILEPVRNGALDKVETLDELRNVTGSIYKQLSDITYSPIAGSVDWYRSLAGNTTLTSTEMSQLWSLALLCREMRYVAGDDSLILFVTAFAVACDNLVKALLTEQMRNQTIF